VKEFTTDNIRNICLAGQRSCGKTSLADAIAFHSGANNRVGRVDEGSSFFDYAEAEISRKSSLSNKLLATMWKNRKVNLLDCPGQRRFCRRVLVRGGGIRYGLSPDRCREAESRWAPSCSGG